MTFCRTEKPTLLFFLVALVLAGQLAADHAFGQSRNFVTGITPVIGRNGAVVGGISVDADGVVTRAAVEHSGELGRARTLAIDRVSRSARKASKLRKISLRKLEQELVRLQKANLPLSGEIEFLAGLQRIEYVFVDPKNKDIILAGPAEGWRVDQNGFVVGVSSGLPVIELCDLVLALRIDRAESIQGITCSMDATPEGLRNYSDYMRHEKPKFNEQSLYEMRSAIGNFEVSFTGVQPDSHYARVLIAADLMMKRLGMNLENSPVRGVTSYVQMLQKSKKRIRQNTSPRWWLAVDYEKLLRDKQGLTWQIRGPAVKAMTEDDFLNRDGQKTATGNVNPLAQKWAADFTEHYQRLSAELPIFGQLRNCIDLAVVGALLTKYELFDKAGFQSSILMDADQMRLAKYPVPQFTPPQISYAPNGRGWIVTLSGGIGIDGWSVASNTQIDTDLPALQRQVVDSSGDHWWWD